MTVATISRGVTRNPLPWPRFKVDTGEFGAVVVYATSIQDVTSRSRTARSLPQVKDRTGVDVAVDRALVRSASSRLFRHVLKE